MTADGRAPMQYAGKLRCVCGTWLSRYNPTTVCGPCSYGAVAALTAGRRLEWRRPAGRGPLLPDTTDTGEVR